MKKRTVFTTIFVIVATAFIVVGFFLLRQNANTQKNDNLESVYTLQDEAFSSAAHYLDTKLYESGIDGLYYSLSPVKYYAAKEKKISEMTVGRTVKTTVQIAGTKMSFEIPVVVHAGQVFGVAKWQGDSGIYREAFAVLLDMPQGFSLPQKYLLLLDTSGTDLDAAHRQYSEAISVDEKGNSGGYVFDQRNRTVESSGKLRTDWDVFNMELIHGSEKAVYSLSGRNYAYTLDAQQYDLRVTEGGTTKTVAKKISGGVFFSSAKTLRYMRAEKEQWQLFAYQAGKEKKTATIKGNFFEDFTVLGDIVLRKADNAVVLSGSGEELAAPVVFKSLYSVAKYENKLIFIGKEENRDSKAFKVQLILIKDLATGRVKALYANDIFDEGSSLCLSDEGMVTVKGGKSVFISYTALEKMAGNVIK